MITNALPAAIFGSIVLIFVPMSLDMRIAWFVGLLVLKMVHDSLINWLYKERNEK